MKTITNFKEILGEGNNGKFTVITSTGLIDSVKLKTVLNDSNGTDTDLDGLYDWDEVNVEIINKHLKNEGKQELKTVNNSDLPLFSDLILHSSEWGSFKPYLWTETDFARYAYSNCFDNVRILPIVSDPSKADSDGDEMADYDEVKIYNTNPLVVNKFIIATYRYDDKGFLTDKPDCFGILNWSISNKDFIDTTTLSKKQFIAILNSKNIKELTEQEISQAYDKCVNFVHDPYTIYSENNKQYGKVYKSLMQEWMIKKEYDSNVGVNPEIISSTWKWESGYSVTNCFGIRNGTNATFEKQIESCIINYLTKYYYALYIQEVENSELVAVINDYQATFNPCNAAMYSRCIYNTDNFLTWKQWHDTIEKKSW